MNKMILVAVCALLAAHPALAQTAAPAADKKAPSEKQLRQQERMKACNQKAADKKGEERKQFMGECLKDKQAAQQNRMATCNQDAGGKQLKGEARKQFMSECLKGDQPAQAKPAEAAKPAEKK